MARPLISMSGSGVVFRFCITAFDHYLHREFNDAISLPDDLLKDDADDPVVKLLAGKCKAFLCYAAAELERYNSVG